MAVAPGDFGTRRLPIKPLYLIGMGIIALTLVLSYGALKDALRPYTTSVQEAESSGRAVQLAGYLGSKGAYDAAGNFTFNLQDPTGKMVKVVYGKPKPANFEQAVSIVAIGHYDASHGIF